MKRFFPILCLFLLTAVLLCGCQKSPHSDIGESADFTAQVIRTNETDILGDVKFPDCLVIRSKDALDAYFSENQTVFDLAYLSRACPVSGIDFYTAMQQYDEAWFRTHDLLLARVRENSGSISLQVNNVSHAKGEGLWTVTIKEDVPQVCTNDMAFWHVLVEVQKCECVPHGATVVLE